MPIFLDECMASFAKLNVTYDAFGILHSIIYLTFNPLEFINYLDGYLDGQYYHN